MVHLDLIIETTMKLLHTVLLLSFLTLNQAYASEEHINYDKLLDNENLKNMLINCNFDDFLDNFYSAQSAISIIEHTKNIKCEYDSEIAFAGKLDDSIPRYTVAELQKNYEKNEYAFQKKLNAKWPLVFGIISKISLSIDNKPIVRLKSKNNLLDASFHIATEADNEYMKFYFDQQQEILENLSSGDNILLHCKKLMFIMNTPMGQDCVIL